jgi:hypothetical protein
MTGRRRGPFPRALYWRSALLNVSAFTRCDRGSESTQTSQSRTPIWALRLRPPSSGSNPCGAPGFSASLAETDSSRDQPTAPPVGSRTQSAQRTGAELARNQGDEAVGRPRDACRVGLRSQSRAMSRKGRTRSPAASRKKLAAHRAWPAPDRFDDNAAEGEPDAADADHGPRCGECSAGHCDEAEERDASQGRGATAQLRPEPSRGRSILRRAPRRNLFIVFGQRHGRPRGKVSPGQSGQSTAILAQSRMRARSWHDLPRGRQLPPSPFKVTTCRNHCDGAACCAPTDVARQEPAILPCSPGAADSSRLQPASAGFVSVAGSL